MDRHYTQKDDERYNELLNRRKRFDLIREKEMRAIMKGLEKTRKEQGLSRRKFSTLLGLTETHYPKILSGKRRLSVPAILTFLWVFDTNLFTLTGHDNPSSADAAKNKLER